jgi:threonine dehydratase
MLLSPDIVASANKRISPYLKPTPLLESLLLNQWLGHRILFKAECFQKTGAFKIRGALNTLLTLREKNNLPKSVVAFSSGNHAQAVAFASQMLGVKATICIPARASSIKQQATRGYGAEVIVCPTRQEAEDKVKDYISGSAYFIPPYDHEDVIAGQGTACFEALKDNDSPDAIFAPCGGGGLLSGTWLATQSLNSKAQVYGVEPLRANDAAQSLASGHIIRFKDTPNTIADGVETLSVSERTFVHLQKLAGILEIEEEPIFYWTQWLTHLLKVIIEPTSALAMAGAVHWLRQQKTPKTALVILSGGNIAPNTHRTIWEKDRLNVLPNIS